MPETPIETRELVFRGIADGGAHSLEAHQIVPLDQIEGVIAFMAANGYKCDPVIDEHVTPVTGELYGDPADFVPTIVTAHTAYLEAQGITDLPAYVQQLEG